ncbi:MAG: metallopeptidase TldD-related protein [Myxococcota bacterium]
MDRRRARRLTKTLHGEIARAMDGLRIKGHKRPHFLSHLLRHREEWRIQGSFGALTEDQHSVRRSSLCDVRVGSYRRDQVREGGLSANSTELESYDLVSLPIGGDSAGFLHGLWRLTEAKYREACDDFLHKRAVALNYLEAGSGLGALERRPPERAFRFTNPPEFDRDGYRDYVLRGSRLFKRYPLLRDGHVRVRGTNATRIFVSSEGAEVVETSVYRAVELSLWFLAADGHALPYAETFFVRDDQELPSVEALGARLRTLYARLDALAKAPRLRSYVGPVLLDPGPAGLLVHEAIGHRLEGSRLLSEGEGQTFRDAAGQRILMGGIDIWDDPSMRYHDGQSLTGHYEYDDEGVPASKATLVEDGVLQGFLTTRSPIEKRHQSNGHARSAHHARAISRMGVTVMKAREGLDDGAMRRAFLDEIRRQGVPFGVRIASASGGETTTEAYDFQAFLGQVDVATRVFPDGREELVRGVDVVGTPLNAVRAIIAASERQGVDNAWCGAESGYVPVSTIAPSLLVDELELQSKPMRKMTQFAYPMPWEK